MCAVPRVVLRVPKAWAGAGDSAVLTCNCNKDTNLYQSTIPYKYKTKKIEFPLIMPRNQWLVPKVSPYTTLGLIFRLPQWIKPVFCYLCQKINSNHKVVEALKCRIVVQVMVAIPRYNCYAHKYHKLRLWFRQRPQHYVAKPLKTAT